MEFAGRRVVSPSCDWSDRVSGLGIPALHNHHARKLHQPPLWLYTCKFAGFADKFTGSADKFAGSADKFAGFAGFIPLSPIGPIAARGSGEVHKLPSGGRVLWGGRVGERGKGRRPTF